MVLLLLVALVLVIALPAALVRKPGPAAPAFLYNTKQLTASNATMDFQLAVDKAAVVHYVLLQKSADGSPSGWSRMAATDVQLASQGLGFSSFEVSRVQGMYDVQWGTACLCRERRLPGYSVQLQLDHRQRLVGAHRCRCGLPTCLRLEAGVVV